MAFGLTAFLFLLSMKECFANTNSTSFHGTSSSPSLTTILRPSSQALPNLVNSPTASPPTTTLLSTVHQNFNTNFASSSILQSPPNETISTKNNRTFESKLTTMHINTGTKKSLTTSTLLPTPSSGNMPVSSILPKTNKTKSFSSSLWTVNPSLTTSLSRNISFPSTLAKVNKAKSFSGSLWTANASLASNISTRTVSTPQNLTTHQELSTVQFSSSTVVPTQGSNESSTRESLLSGQLAGVALILLILVVLLLIICLGNFADEPVFNERELFTEEVSMENLGRYKDNQGQQEDEEWKFDPLFAWSPRKSFDSKL